MLKGALALSDRKVLLFIGLTHELLTNLKDGDALTVRVDDMTIPIPFRDLVITMKDNKGEPTIPPMSNKQAASTCVVVVHKKVVKKALKHKDVGTICCPRPIKGDVDLMVFCGPTDADLEAAADKMTQDLGAVDVTPKPSLN